MIIHIIDGYDEQNPSKNIVISFTMKSDVTFATNSTEMKQNGTTTERPSKCHPRCTIIQFLSPFPHQLASPFAILHRTKKADATTYGSRSINAPYHPYQWPTDIEQITLRGDVNRSDDVALSTTNDTHSNSR